MQIQKLVINGFGPYATQQTLDFAENLEGKNIFVITGDTGAGKTTIFDAINFALFGEASGSDREGKSLRSDYADAKTPTEVALWFSIRGNEYYVKRSPQYFRAKQRGEGLTESKAEAEMRLPEGKTLTGVENVKNEVTRILGINAEQFKQLVMIPQGEFKKLLVADSDKKEDIFRRIFGTRTFETIQRKIKDQAAELKKGVVQGERDRAQWISSFDYGEDAVIQERIAAGGLGITEILAIFDDKQHDDVEEQKRLEEKKIVVEQEIEKISKAITIKEANNQKLLQLDHAKARLAELESEKASYDEKKEKMEQAQKAHLATIVEQQYQEKNQAYKIVEQEKKETEQKCEVDARHLKEAEEKLLVAKEKEATRGGLEREKEEKVKQKEQVVQYELVTKEISQLEATVATQIKNIADTDQLIEATQAQEKKCEAYLETVAKAKEEKASLEIEKEQVKHKKEALEELVADFVEWQGYVDLHQSKALLYVEQEARYKVAKQDYEYKETVFKKNQAGILALDLEEGKACPVCGATSHPNLAQLTQDGISEETVEKSKVAYEAVKAETESQLAEIKTIQDRKDVLEQKRMMPKAKALFEIEVVADMAQLREQTEQEVQRYATQLVGIVAKLKELQVCIDKQQKVEEEKTKQQQLRDSYVTQKEKDNKVLGEAQMALGVAKSKQEEMLANWQGKVQSVAELEIVIATLEKEIKEIQLAYTQWEKKTTELRSIWDREKSKYETKVVELATRKKEKEMAQTAFKEKAHELGFLNYKQYEEARLTAEAVQQLQKELEAYTAECIAMKERCSSLLAETKDLAKEDISVWEEKQTAIKASRQKMDGLIKLIFARIDKNKTVIEQVKKINQAIATSEKSYSVIGRLAKCVTGDNAKRMSFERYVLAAYFEDIIFAANLRFAKMTANRYQLFRKEEVGDKRRGQGLDLEVLDNYTGKKRDVKTLSGGESFKASLALALGLADVVQSGAGGIQLDTMFIDEGFGTLDMESLDHAIECLVDLQNDGRVVGIISHVQELKDRIGTRLEVTATNTGSKATFKV